MRERISMDFIHTGMITPPVRVEMRKRNNCLGNVSEGARYIYLLFSQLTVVCNQVNRNRHEWQETVGFSDLSLFPAVSGVDSCRYSGTKRPDNTK